jgi:hypothetical protein
MKLWTCLFTAPKSLVSARIAAPDRASACSLLSAAGDVHFDPASRRPNGVILQYAGEVEAEAAVILSVVTADGQTIVNEARP